MVSKIRTIRDEWFKNENIYLYFSNENNFRIVIIQLFVVNGSKFHFYFKLTYLERVVWGCF